MARYCFKCHRSFPTLRAVQAHITRDHRHPRRQRLFTTKYFHEYLNARPCDSEGNFLPPDSDPPEEDLSTDWGHWQRRTKFEWAEVTFEKMQSSKGDINHMLEILAAEAVHESNGERKTTIYPSQDKILADIDAIKLGEALFDSFDFKWTGPLGDNPRPWKLKTWTLHARDAREVFRNQLATREFADRFDTTPFTEFTEEEKRVYQNLMSGMWANAEADCIEETCANAEGAMLAPIVSGADKTTVSVATGDTDYHPVYSSLGNFHNELRRGHSDAVSVIAFLAIIKGTQEDEEDPEFRLFKKQAYHAQMVKIFEPLRGAMTTPEVTMCPDGHYRKVIYSLGPFMADYPEQVYLACIVQGWCPKCDALPTDLDGGGEPRERELDGILRDGHTSDDLWDVFGIVDGIKPYTEYFPRADIHELLTPDLLHQLIKGTFKDHLLEWVLDYIEAKYKGRDKQRRLRQLDLRLRAVPSFPGIRRFKDGRNFKQWTGDDSKALMKIIIPALRGLVPDRMVQCLGAYMDFCFMARRSGHDVVSLEEMEDKLALFHELREIFIEVEVRVDFNLPRQHALVHYTRGIRLFGSPNGLCTSITESKHIEAVKRPWRKSSRNDPLPQILLHNVRQSKLRAQRADFGRRGMIDGNILMAALQQFGLLDAEQAAAQPHQSLLTIYTTASEHEAREDHDVMDVDGDEQPPSVWLAKRPRYSRPIDELPLPARITNALAELIPRFLYDQTLADDDGPTGDEVDLEDCPVFEGNVGIYRSARAVFYAPSELCGSGGMHAEMIRSNPNWYGQYERFDTVLVQNGEEDDVMGGMLIGRVLSFVSFRHNDVRYPAAVVELFEPVGDELDPVTGMWIVKPQMEHGERKLALIHTDCLVRACQIIGLYGKDYIPEDFHHSYTHHAFSRFYFNKYADYHTHECYPLR